jgi:hypothetical protein
MPLRSIGVGAKQTDPGSGVIVRKGESSYALGIGWQVHAELDTAVLSYRGRGVFA